MSYTCGYNICDQRCWYGTFYNLSLIHIFQGIKGWAGDHVEVFQTKEEAENYSCEQGKKICIVAQTTFNYNKFKELVEILEKKSYDVSVLNTICNATKERQTEAQSIAETVDAMIVIGDKHSSNTQKLFEICRKACNNTYYIQTLGEMCIRDRYRT